MSDREPGREDQSTDTGEESFIERWSRRKQAAQNRAEPEELLDPEELDANSESQALAEGSTEPAAEADPEPPGDEDMPPLESIDEGGSVSAFFSPKVSAGLRRAALRRLFSQPEFGAVDMLDDYAKDYTNRAPLGDIVTADMRYRAEQAAKRLARKLGDRLEAADGEDARVAMQDDEAQSAVEAARKTGGGVDKDSHASDDNAPAKRPAADSEETDDDDDHRPA